MDVLERAAALRTYGDETAECVRCPLSESRSQVVFGSGAHDAELFLVGEAPGFHEDRSGVPFAGEAGRLLERLLASIGLDRSEVYVANLLKCRPPQNRDPAPEEIAACDPHLFRQIELIGPKVVATLGNVATRLLSGRDIGITRVHGQEQHVTLGGSAVLLYPLYHPAAALYTPSMLEVLERDFARIPELLGHPAPQVTRAPGFAQMPQPAGMGGQPHAVQTQRDAVPTEPDAVRTERDAVRTERDAVRTERDAVQTQRRDAGALEREAVQLGLF